MKPDFKQEQRGGGLILLLWLIGLIILAMGLPGLDLQTQLDKWNLKSDAPGSGEKDVINAFGNVDPVIILVKTENLFSHENLGQLKSLSMTLFDSVPYVEAVSSILDYRILQPGLRSMRPERLIPSRYPDNQSFLDSLRDRALQEPGIAGNMLSLDGRDTWIQVEFESQKSGDLTHQQLREVGQKLLEVIQPFERADFKLLASGIPIISHEQTEYFSRETLRLGVWVFVISVLTILFIFRSWRLLILILITILSSFLAALGLLGHLGIELETTLFTVPLFLGLAISLGYSVHIINRFNIYRENHTSDQEALRFTLRQVRGPLFYTSMTTIGALLTFNLIDIGAVQQIGNISTLVLIFIYLMNRFILPQLLLIKFAKSQMQDRGKHFLVSVSVRLSLLTIKLTQYPKSMYTGLFVLVVVLVVGMSQINPSSNSLETLGSELPYLKQQIEIGQSPLISLYSYSAVFQFPADIFESQFQDVIQIINDVQHELTSADRKLRVRSGINGLKQIKQQLFPDTKVEDLDKITDSQAELEMYLSLVPKRIVNKWVNQKQHLVRMTVGVPEFSHRTINNSKRMLEAYLAEKYPDIKVYFSGTILKFADIQEYLVGGQIIAVLFSLIIIILLLIFVFRSIGMGLIAAIPNLIPIMAVGAAMGYLKIPLDSITITLMPMVLGIAVDDTIHLMLELSRLKLQSNNFAAVVTESFRTVGSSLLTTTIILIIVFGVYLSSDVLVFRRLALLVCIGLGSALATDFFITPILMKDFIKPSSSSNLKTTGSI